MVHPPILDKIYEARHALLNLSTPLVKAEIPTTYFAPREEDLELVHRRNLAALLSNYPDSPLTPGLPPVFGAGFNSPFNQFQKMNSGVANQLEQAILPTLQNFQNLQISPASLNRFQSNNNQCGNKNFLAPNLMTPFPQARPSLSPRVPSTNTSGYQSLNSSTNSLEQLYTSYQHNTQANTSGYQSLNSSNNSLEQLYTSYQQNVQANSSSVSASSQDNQTFASGNIARRLSDNNGAQSFDNNNRTSTSGFGLPVSKDNIILSKT